MPNYGLTGYRNEDGSLTAKDHTFDWKGEEVTIRVVPPSAAQIDEYQEFGDEMKASKFEEIVERHLVKPETPEGGWTFPELDCYLHGIVDFATGGTDEHADVLAALEEMEEGDAGNSPPPSDEAHT